MKAPMLLALAGLCISTAQSAEPQSAEPVSLTLACQGTVTMHVYGGPEYDPELMGAIELELAHEIEDLGSFHQMVLRRLS